MVEEARKVTAALRSRIRSNTFFFIYALCVTNTIHYITLAVKCQEGIGKIGGLGVLAGFFYGY
jgi:hypothetical protein